MWNSLHLFVVEKTIDKKFGFVVESMSYFTGIVMMKEKTPYLMPSAVFRLSSLVLFLLTLPSVG